VVAAALNDRWSTHPSDLQALGLVTEMHYNLRLLL
jgi:hypothetical protein